MNNEPITLEEEVVLKCRVFNLVREKIKLPSGKVVIRETVTHPGAVVVLPQDQDGNFLLLSQYRQPLKRAILEFPAGTLEMGEDPLACAKRELIEETGFSATNLKPLGAVYTAPGFCNEVIHGFFATGLAPAEAEMDEDEIIEVKRMTTEDIDRAILDGSLCDAKSIAAFYQVKLQGCGN